MMTSHPDIEEIDNKLTAKRRRKGSSPPKNKRTRINDMMRSPQIKIVLKKEPLSPTIEEETKFDHLKTIIKKEETTLETALKEENEFKQLQKELLRVEREMLRKQKEDQKRLIEEEKNAKKEEREIKKQLAEEEKRMKQFQREEREEERLKQKEQEKIEKEERRKIREEEQSTRLEKKKKLEEESALKRREKALKGMKYLLSVSEKYSDFYKEKLAAEDKPVKQ